MKQLNEEQRKFLLSGLRKARVSQRTIGGGRSASYLEAYDVRKTLIQVFGFGNFDITTVKTECVVDRPVEWNDSRGNAKSGFDVAYLATVELLIHGDENHPATVYSASAVGSANHQPELPTAHDHALKTAESDALKRCAINLGTQFGLSLYQNGSLNDIVYLTLDVDTPPESIPQDQVVPEDQTPDEPTEAEAPQQQPAEPVPDQPAAVSQDWDGDVTALLEQIRAVYSLPTAAQKIQRIGEMKAALPALALNTVVQDRHGNDITIERALDTAASDAMRKPVNS